MSNSSDDDAAIPARRGARSRRRWWALLALLLAVVGTSAVLILRKDGQRPPPANGDRPAAPAAAANPRIADTGARAAGSPTDGGRDGDGASHTSTVSGSTPPPTPVLQRTPSDPAASATARFEFEDDSATGSAQCQLDDGAFSACVSPMTYTGLTATTHLFRVQAIDAMGTVSRPATHTWTVQPPVSGFTLSGNLTQPLSPGATSALDVRITNPFTFAINVTVMTVTVNEATTKNGRPNPACRGTVNLVAHRQYTGRSPLTIARNATRSLSDLGVARGQWPQLQMPNLSTNQDACKSTDFSFTYFAEATKANW